MLLEIFGETLLRSINFVLDRLWIDVFAAFATVTLPRQKSLLNAILHAIIASVFVYIFRRKLIETMTESLEQPKLSRQANASQQQPTKTKDAFGSPQDIQTFQLQNQTQIAQK